MLLPSSEDYYEVAGSKVIGNEYFNLLNDGVFLRRITAGRGVEWLLGLLRTQTTQCSKPDPETGCADCGFL